MKDVMPEHPASARLTRYERFLKAYGQLKSFVNLGYVPDIMQRQTLREPRKIYRALFLGISAYGSRNLPHRLLPHRSIPHIFAGMEVSGNLEERIEKMTGDVVTPEELDEAVYWVRDRRLDPEAFE